VFRKHGIRYSGHRFPYLRWDEERVDRLGLIGFQWDSSKVISWNSLDPSAFDKREWTSYQRILKTYKPVDADKSFSLPYVRKELVEIPVSVPDDDILIERLGLKNNGEMEKVWGSMLRKVRNRGELLVLQVHPERYRLYENALEKTLMLAKDGGDVWTAPLGEIARWWREKEKFDCKVERISGNRYRITAKCSDRATVLLKNGLMKNQGETFWDSSVVVEKREWEMESPVRPLIGVSPDASTEVTRFLKTEGFAHEIAKDGRSCSFFLDHKGSLEENERRQILESIERTRFPLIRFWRWPNKARYSLAVTGDIDGIDLWDFWRRFYG